MSDCWTVLGLAPTSDQTAIRRAYARKLKVTNPEDDPQDFMALREALDQAQQWARWQAFDEADVQPADATEPAAGEAAPPWGDRPPTEPDPPAHPYDPDAAAFAAEREASFVDLHAREEALYDAVSRGDEAAMGPALDALLAAPALDDIGARDVTGEWLARVIAEHFPRSDAIIEAAIAGFGWRHDARGVSPAVAAVLERLEVWTFVNTASRPHGALHNGWRALTAKDLPGWRRRLGAAATGATSEVRQLLTIADHQLPGIADWLDPGAMAWWRQFLTRDWFDLKLLWLMPLGAVLGGVIAAGLDLSRAAERPLSLLAALLAPVAGHWLIARPRRRVLAAPVQPAWRDGWLAVLALPLVAMALPDTLPALGTLAAVGLGFIVWTWIMAGRFGSVPRLGLGGLGGAAIAFVALSGSRGHSFGVWLAASLPVGIAWWRGRDDITDLAHRLPRPEWLLGAAGPLLVVLVATAVPLPPPQRLPLAALAASTGLLMVAVAGHFAAHGWPSRLVVLARVVIILALLQLLGQLPPRPRPAPPAPDVRALAAPALLAGSKSGGAVPEGPIDGWLTAADYPPQVFARAGTIILDIRLLVSDAGRVRSCRIRQDGGAQPIADSSCAAITARARFKPARDPQGRPRLSLWQGRLSWVVSDKAAAMARATADLNAAAAARLGPVAPSQPAREPPKPPKLLVPSETLVTTDDLPADVFPADGSYRISYRLDIDSVGKVTACTITGSSGVRLVDRATCAAARQRARFAPGRAPDGTPLGGTWTQTLGWRVGKRPAAADDRAAPPVPDTGS